MATKEEIKSAFDASLAKHLIDVNKDEQKRQDKKVRDDDINFRKLDDSLKKNKEELKNFRTAVDKEGKAVNDMRRRDSKIREQELANRIKEQEQEM